MPKPTPLWKLIADFSRTVRSEPPRMMGAAACVIAGTGPRGGTCPKKVTDKMIEDEMRRRGEARKRKAAAARKKTTRKKKTAKK